jgi:hypothetical protein
MINIEEKIPVRNLLNCLLADGYGRITRYVFSGARYLYNKFMRTKKYWVCGIHKVCVIDGKIRYILLLIVNLLPQLVHL